MNLLVIREPSSDKSTLGSLYVNKVWFSFCLEDVIREIKIQNQTAIPKGKYKIIIDHSTRFNRLMPHILDVPNFTGIRIHNGNTDSDTDGCILVGSIRQVNFVGNSVATFAKLFDVISKTTEEINIEIIEL